MVNPASAASRSQADPGRPSTGSEGRRRHRGHHRRGLGLVVNDAVVERPVRLDVAHPGTGHPGEPIECADLVDDLVGQGRWRDVDGPPAEPGQVPIAHLRTDHDSALGRRRAHPTEDVRVPGVESAGHVGTCDDLEQSLVVAQSPDAEPFAEVAVQIDPHRSHGWAWASSTSSACRSVLEVSGARKTQMIVTSSIANT